MSDSKQDTGPGALEGHPVIVQLRAKNERLRGMLKEARNRLNEYGALHGSRKPGRKCFCSVCTDSLGLLKRIEEL